MTSSWRILIIVAPAITWSVLAVLASSCFRRVSSNADTRPSSGKETSPGYDVITRYSSRIDSRIDNSVVVDELTLQIPAGSFSPDVMDAYVISIESRSRDSGGASSQSLSYAVSVTQESDGALATMQGPITFTLTSAADGYEQEPVIVARRLSETAAVETDTAYFFQAQPTSSEQSAVLKPDQHGTTVNYEIFTGVAAEWGYSSTIDCAGLPGGHWVRVLPYFDAPRSAWSEPSFCVMKYEAKDDGTGQPISQANEQPFVNVSRDTAHELCTALGEDYTLITNAMWQSVARQIETAQSAGGSYLNWQEGVFTSATDQLNRGHSDNGPAGRLAASTDDNLGCLGVTSNGDPADNCGGVWHINKRTHTLPSEDVIWDMAANAAEWVLIDTTEEDEMAFVNATLMSAAEGYDLAKWGPAGDHAAKTSDSGRAGLGVAYLNYPPGAVTRGGSFGGGNATGIYNSVLGKLATEPLTFVGFRCAYQPLP